LNPKKAKELSNLTATEFGLDKEMVDDILDFYWVKVRKMLGNIEHPYIRLPNLGTFSIRYYNLVRQIRRVENILEQPAPTSFQKYIYYNSHKQKIDNYKRARGIIEEYITKKKQHIDAKQNKKDLEE